MTIEDKLQIIGFHVKETNRLWSEIRDIKKLQRSDPDFRDHGDVKCLATRLECHIELAHFAVCNKWVHYAGYANIFILHKDELPDELRYYKSIKSLLNLLKNQPTKRRK